MRLWYQMTRDEAYERSIPMRLSSAAWRALILALVTLLVVASAVEPASLTWAQEVGVLHTGASPKGESTLGDFVWRDDDQNGLPALSEPGIDGVLIELYLDDDDGVFEPGDDDSLIAAMLTGDNLSTPVVDHGWYDFSISVTDALYWVQIHPSNFHPGGPLEGAHLTTASTFGESPLLVYLPSGIQDYGDADFGYYGAPSSTPTATATDTAPATITSTATATSTETETVTATHTLTATATAAEPSTPTSTATATVTEMVLPTSTPTATPTATPTIPGTATATSTTKPTHTATPIATTAATATPSGTISSTPTRQPGQIYLPIIIVPPPPVATPTLTPTATPSIPGFVHPKAVAVDSNSNRVYATARDSNRLYAFDGATLTALGYAEVGREPWGVSVNGAANKVYVANWGSGDLYVLDASTLAVRTVIPVGPKPTFAKINPVTNRVFVVTYGNSSLAVIDGNTDTLEAIVPSGGTAAWGLAVDPNANIIYISNRDSGTVTSLDGANNYQVIRNRTIAPCGGAGSSPYGLDFNPLNSKLYIACSSFHNVNRAAVYRATVSGLVNIAFLPIGEGGDDAGGGVAVNIATLHVFFTNSHADTVSVVSGLTDNVIATVPTGRDPFGVGVNMSTGRVFVANRTGNDITSLVDNFSP